jgi:hypothetical protein
MVDLGGPGSLLAAAKRGAWYVAGRFEFPDDDWQPMLLVRMACGQIVGGPIRQCANQAVLGEAVRQMLVAYGAVEAAFVASSWVLIAPPGMTIDHHTSVAEHPARRECVVINYVSRERARLEIADIERSAAAPLRIGAFWGLEGSGLRSRVLDGMRSGIAVHDRPPQAVGPA